jgi:glycosyltransferase involved in cell wall biosynthesis
MAATLTVIIITFNEERNIVDCIRSVSSADEVSVVDSGSTDLTLRLAGAEGVRVVSHPMIDFADQRNYATSLAMGDWILHVDADERISGALWQELRSKIATNNATGYKIPRLNYIFGRPLRHGGWYPHYQFRLIRRDQGHWVRTVHETVAVSGVIGRLTQPLIHYGHPNIEVFVAKLNAYTSIEAREKQGSVLRLSLLALTYPPAYFLYKYVFQGGFLDGWRGLAIALLLAYYRGVAFLKALEHHHR